MGMAAWAREDAPGHRLRFTPEPESDLEFACECGGQAVAQVSAEADDESLSSVTVARSALGAGQLRLDYQPRISLSSLQILSVEALVRWRHPTRGDVPPDSFIPLAEQSGDILSIGSWVLDEAIRHAAIWSKLDSPVHVAIN